ncbi:polyprenol phosphomannose-dependent alpha 1,6 mannosyltransferase MptB [Nesterenkonia sp. MY13]|uniref:Polyprenol phosphomannose-dependent alpha 1,6 mannosyltransferase MptB n=1 Tax=Nesterenkonia sedimenti TaxID=1463632 RepID=A0A7X8YCR3_9MICC|nr:polyprenol phosphomannose-dependent alpha 1,6 mannosyltransferase MptB [Nesterenkonia sedimenti]NLS08591.1 polyprenol phosphomannose-dependent alpha 1,6 mannosyltransferase MptB [Nesterenkonia sedimenti]
MTVYNPITRAADSARETMSKSRVTSWLIGGRDGGVSHTLRQGLLAALMIMIGSWGVGWLIMAPGYWLEYHPALQPLRATAAGTITCTVLLMLGALLLLRSWLRLSQRINGWNDPNGVKVMYRALLMWGTPLFLCFPIFSRDIFSYLAQGGLLYIGHNPYEAGVSELPGWFAAGADDLWAESPSPYGPLFLLIAQGVWHVSIDMPDMAIPLFRILAVFGVVLMAVVIPRLARAFGSQPAWALWLCLLNPLSLMVFIPAAHNDSLMIGLMLAGAWYALQRRRLVAVLLLIAAIAIKPIAMVVLPFAVLLTPQSTAHYMYRIREWAVAGVLAGVLLFGGGWLLGVGIGWFTAALGAGAEVLQGAPVGLLGIGVGWLVETTTGVDSSLVATWVYGAARIASAVVLTVMLLRPRMGNPLLWSAYGLTAVVLTSSVIQPWYLLWILPLFAVVHIYRGRVLMLVILLITVMTLAAMVGQLSVAQWLDTLLIQIIAAAVAAAYLGYLIFCDPNTTGLFRYPEKSQRWNAADGWLHIGELSTPDRSWSADQVYQEVRR